MYPRVRSVMLGRVIRPFLGWGLERFVLIRKAHNLLYNLSKPKGVVLLEIQGNKMYVDMSDPVIPKELYMTGIHELEVTNLVKKIVKEGMTVVDIGANIGYYALLTANLVGESGRVFAFEPSPDNYSLLTRNIEVNNYKNVTPVKKAISNKTGTAKLFLCPDNKGDHRLWDSPEGREWVEIETTTLDKFFENHNPAIGVIKMDIEGAEAVALQGMNNIIMRNPNLKIITEFWPEAIKGTGFSPIEFLNSLTEHGFRLNLIKRNGVKPVTPSNVVRICEDRLNKGLGGFINIYCERK